MCNPIHFAVALLLIPGTLAQTGESTAVPGSVGIHPSSDSQPAISPVVQGVAYLRAEYFAIPGDAGAPPQAVIALRRYSQKGGVVLEEDVIFQDGELFTSQHEQIRDSGVRMIWRELDLGQGAAHTLIAEGIGSGRKVSLLRHGIRSRTHAELPADTAGSKTCTTPLALVESLRRPSESDRSERVLHPHHVGAEPLVVQPVEHATWGSLQGQWGGGEAARVYRIQGAESGYFRELWFHGDELVAFRWRPRGPLAVRIAECDWEEQANTWRALARPRIPHPKARALEAAAPFLDKRERFRPVWYRMEASTDELWKGPQSEDDAGDR